MDENNKKKLGYEPDIKYEEDYYSDGTKPIDDEDTGIQNDISYDDTVMDHIQDNIDYLVQLIPMLPLEIQTAVNQVFKPVFNDWYLNIKGNHYPSYIPEPGKPIFKPKDPGGGSDPGGDDPGGYDPEGKDPSGGGGDPGGGDPPVGGDPGDIKPGPYFPWEPQPNPEPVKRDPIIYVPEISDPVIKPEPIIKEKPLPIDDDVFAPSSPFTVEYVKIDPVKLAECEYIKNSADVYLYYTRKLKDTLNKFVFNCLNAIVSSNNKTGRSDAEDFILRDLTLSDVNVAENIKHLTDLGVRGEVNGRFKLNFSLNTFTLESTLYHLKNYKVSKDLRLRYEKEEMHADGTAEGSRSDRMLSGLRQQYDKNYETSYINLYKHLNSSTVVLEDALNALSLAVAAKEILFKDGGSKK